jgi:hypothetical protein
LPLAVIKRFAKNVVYLCLHHAPCHLFLLSLLLVDLIKVDKIVI